jgi:hypothetical protein
MRLIARRRSVVLRQAQRSRQMRPDVEPLLSCGGTRRHHEVQQRGGHAIAQSLRNIEPRRCFGRDRSPSTLLRVKREQRCMQLDVVIGDCVRAKRVRDARRGVVSAGTTLDAQTSDIETHTVVAAIVERAHQRACTGEVAARHRLVDGQQHASLRQAAIVDALGKTYRLGDAV